MPKTKILCYIDWFRPGYKAGGITTAFANMLDYLKPYYDFYIVTRNNDYLEKDPHPDVSSDKWNKLEENINVFYLSKVTTKKIKAIVKKIEYNYVYINGIYSFYFSIFPLFYHKNKSHIIINPHGMFSSHALKVKSVKKNIFRKLIMIYNPYKNVIFHVSNFQEKEEVFKITFNQHIKIASQFPKYNKKDNFNVQNQNSNECIKEFKKPGSLYLLSIARISPEKNTLYALQTLNNSSRGEIIFNIYGSVYDEAYWKQCNEIIKKIPPNVTINYFGSIEPEKTEEIINKSHFLFMPTRGENFGHSILESLMEGTPVIISDQTPWRNLQNTAFGPVGWDISLNHPGKFVEIIEYCTTMDQEEYNRMSQAAYKFAKQIINDPATMEANRKLFSIY